MLIDAEHGVKQVDLMLMEMLETKMKPYVLVFTKCDKINVATQNKLIESTSDVLKDKPLAHNVLHFTSSK